jgi:hypothetical protein
MPGWDLLHEEHRTKILQLEEDIKNKTSEQEQDIKNEGGAAGGKRSAEEEQEEEDASVSKRAKLDGEDTAAEAAIDDTEDELLREELQLQAESLWAINDALKAHCSKAHLMDLLEANAQVRATINPH